MSDLTTLFQPKLVVREGLTTALKPEITLVSYNVHFGKNTESLADIFHHEPALTTADVILFQEIEDHVVELKSRAERVAASLGYHCLYAPGETLKQQGTHGLAILSKLPILEYEVVRLNQYKQ